MFITLWLVSEIKGAREGPKASIPLDILWHPATCWEMTMAIEFWCWSTFHGMRKYCYYVRGHTKATSEHNMINSSQTHELAFTCLDMVSRCWSLSRILQFLPSPFIFCFYIFYFHLFAYCMLDIIITFLNVVFCDSPCPSPLSTTPALPLVPSQPQTLLFHVPCILLPILHLWWLEWEWPP